MRSAACASHTGSGRARKATTVEAVRGVDFAVQRGEIFGFLGPNGAGKSTTLRMLATLISPDGGDATIAGADLLQAPAQVRQRIGFVAQSSGTYSQSFARRDLVHQARMYGASKSDAKSAAEAAIAAFQLDAFADRKIATYSGGQRRRLDVALGVIHAPQVIFLDEPTAGLDPLEPGSDVAGSTQAPRRGHDDLPHYALPGRGRRAPVTGSLSSSA